MVFPGFFPLGVRTSAAQAACPRKCPTFPAAECGLWEQRVYAPFLEAQKTPGDVLLEFGDKKGVLHEHHTTACSEEILGFS